MSKYKLNHCKSNLVKAAKEEHAKAFEAAAKLAAANPENDGSEEVKAVFLPQTIAYHSVPSYVAHHPYTYSSAHVVAPTSIVKTIVPSSFSYSVHTAPQVAYAQHLPYVIAA